MTQHFTDSQEQILRQPLDASLIKHRPGAGGKLLKYIKGDNAIDTANRIFGFGGWGYRVVGRGHEAVTDANKGPMEYYTADIELSVTGAPFSFPGDGVGIVGSPYTVEAHEKARKEATTDALKRALRHYGDQFGLCLYDEDDYVDAGDGTLVQVKEVISHKRLPPKRVAESRQPKQVEASAPVEQLDEQIRTRMNELYARAHILGQCSNAAGFLKYAAQVLERSEISKASITLADLERIESDLSSREQARPQPAGAA